MTERKDDRLWGGRFENAPDAQFDAFQRSFAFDRRLLPYEIAVEVVRSGRSTIIDVPVTTLLP